MEYDGIVLGAAIAFAVLHCFTLHHVHGSLFAGVMLGQMALHLALLLYFAHRAALASSTLFNWGLLYIAILIHACTMSLGPITRELDIAYVVRLLRLPDSHVRCVIDAVGYFPLEEYHRHCTCDRGLLNYRVFYARYFPVSGS